MPQLVLYCEGVSNFVGAKEPGLHGSKVPEVLVRPCQVCQLSSTVPFLGRMPYTSINYAHEAPVSTILTSPEPSVHLMAEEALKIDLSLTRPNFRASKEVRNVMMLNQDISGDLPCVS